ncbi:hypothetical protein L1887_27439 [Cichorium endivia]|nr:hypothetical protein L1887_27439 [Cichorium endivia]
MCSIKPKSELQQNKIRCVLLSNNIPAVEKRRRPEEKTANRKGDDDGDGKKTATVVADRFVTARRDNIWIGCDRSEKRDEEDLPRPSSPSTGDEVGRLAARRCVLLNGRDRYGN